MAWKKVKILMDGTEREQKSNYVDTVLLGHSDDFRN